MEGFWSVQFVYFLVALAVSDSSRLHSVRSCLFEAVELDIVQVIFDNAGIGFPMICLHDESPKLRLLWWNLKLLLLSHHLSGNGGDMLPAPIDHAFNLHVLH